MEDRSHKVLLALVMLFLFAVIVLQYVCPGTECQLLRLRALSPAAAADPYRAEDETPARFVPRFNFSADDLLRRVDFNIKGDDLIVFPAHPEDRRHHLRAAPGPQHPAGAALRVPRRPEEVHLPPARQEGDLALLPLLHRLELRAARRLDRAHQLRALRGGQQEGGAAPALQVSPHALENVKSSTLRSAVRCLTGARYEGKMRKTARDASASKPGREKSVEDEGNKQVESRKVGRGELGVTGVQNRVLGQNCGNSYLWHSCSNDHNLWQFRKVSSIVILMARIVPKLMVKSHPTEWSSQLQVVNGRAGGLDKAALSKLAGLATGREDG
ncbi:hypothetical protein DUI87_15187 [Hirundo rustica rustica]|uniref:Heparan-sulfate 6-O-sulfotransferase n=1 Tax=Hirundo rustica rustica TaxID=333673 RepID=A0A3M0K4M3_HIRRU|nr:hypothetical protein DUI87_15187 [Hirundo rustica rustica]